MKEVIKYLKLDWNTILTSSKEKKSLVEPLFSCQTFSFSCCPDFVKNLFHKLQTINHFFFGPKNAENVDFFFQLATLTLHFKCRCKREKLIIFAILHHVISQDMRCCLEIVSKGVQNAIDRSRSGFLSNH